MVATVQTGTLCGIEAHGVSVEVSQARGLPGFDIVGLPEAALRESRVRVLAALVNSGFTLPDRRFIVNLAPADLRKSGASFDLAIAIALLAACGLCAPGALSDTLILGELSLDGRVRPVRGILAHLRSACARGLRSAIIPADDASWAGLVSGMKAHLAAHLSDAVGMLEGVTPLPCARPIELLGETASGEDLRDVCGQAAAKRALEVAAAGNH
ncbi:MAG TPA: magnesium chelatase domain-containing protein, partial [Polyangiales bacterium]